MQQPDLPFEDLPPPLPPVDATEPSRALRIVATGAKELSRNQRRFNKLLARIETLRAQKAAETAKLDAALAEYGRRVAPLELKEHAQRCALVRTLAGFWRAPKGLGKRQRACLRDLLLGQFVFLEARLAVEEGGDLDVLLDDLLADKKRGQEEEDKKLGIVWDEDGDESEDDGADSGPGMNLKEMAKKIFGRMSGAYEDDEADEDEAERDEGEHENKGRKQTAAQLKREQREKEMEAARKRGIATIYKQLAKVLHPDLERDPARQAEKLALMQQVTAAYQAGDLHTLLQLELEFIHREENRAAELSEQKLAIYCDLLDEQVAQLEGDLHRLIGEPRYVVLRPFFVSYAGRLADWGETEATLRVRIRSIEASLGQFNQGGAVTKEELRGALKAFAEQEKRRARRRRFYGDNF